VVTIQVVNSSSGKPASNVKVSVAVGWDGTYSEHTDSNGEAHFSKVDPGEYEYYVEGNTHRGRLEGRKVVYI
jgi:5-hydroxyisourate hydrolase-like protein (transthyretin family)